MTTRTRRETSLGLFSNPSWPLFSARAPGTTPTPLVAAYTLWWAGDATTLIRESGRGIERCVIRAVQRLGLVLQVLLVHQALQPRSAAVTFRKIWRLSSLPALPEQVQRGAESQIDCGTGLRFASLAAVPPEAFQWVLAAMDSFEVVVPLLLPGPQPLDEEHVRALVSSAFPPDGCTEGSFDWPTFVRRLHGGGGIAVRRTRDLAHGEVSADFFGSEADVERLVQVTEDDHVS